MGVGLCLGFGGGVGGGLSMLALRGDSGGEGGVDAGRSRSLPMDETLGPKETSGRSRVDGVTSDPSTSFTCSSAIVVAAATACSAALSSGTPLGSSDSSACPCSSPSSTAPIVPPAWGPSERSTPKEISGRLGATVSGDNEFDAIAEAPPSVIERDDAGRMADLLFFFMPAASPPFGPIRTLDLFPLSPITLNNDSDQSSRLSSWWKDIRGGRVANLVILLSITNGGVGDDTLAGCARSISAFPPWMELSV